MVLDRSVSLAFSTFRIHRCFGKEMCAPDEQI